MVYTDTDSCYGSILLPRSKTRYDVQVDSVGFDKDRKLIQCWSVSERIALSILDKYGNAANSIKICEVPEHQEENDDQQ